MEKLNIIYFSCACPQRTFDDYFQKGLIEKLPQAQRFNLMIINGLAANEDLTVNAISMPSFNYKLPELKQFERKACNEGKIGFVIPSFSGGLKRRISTYLNTKKEVEKFLSRCDGELIVFVVDVLNQTLGAVARRIAKKRHIKTIGIVTDVPMHRSLARIDKTSKWALLKHKMLSMINLKLLATYDSYMFLTQDMNSVVNQNNRPYIVIEGMIEKGFEGRKEPINEETEKVVLYAGGIHREFGIPLFVEAFIQANIPDAILRIYGNGNYMDELTKISRENQNVEYLGATTIDVIHEEQRNAFLLVNPRLTNADFVKYSFPSKTFECMASGTPLLTTRLPGMPIEYNEFVYFLEPETKEGFCHCLIETLGFPAADLSKKGESARAFILFNKNNVFQAKRLVTFIREVIRSKQ